MTNHPNRISAYRIQDINGSFAHVCGKQAAIARAIEMVGAGPKTSEAALRKHWGVRIARVSGETARSVGL